MNDYEIRLDFADGYEIVTIAAENFGAALAIAQDDPEVERAWLLAMIDREPQEALVYA